MRISSFLCRSLVWLRQSEREKNPKIPGFMACHKHTQCFDSEESSEIFLGLYTNLGLSSNSPHLDKTVKARIHPQTDSIIRERSVPAARARLVYPCSGPVPTAITSPRKSDRFQDHKWPCKQFVLVFVTSFWCLQTVPPLMLFWWMLPFCTCFQAKKRFISPPDIQCSPSSCCRESPGPRSPPRQGTSQPWKSRAPSPIPPTAPPASGRHQSSSYFALVMAPLPALLLCCSSIRGNQLFWTQWPQAEAPGAAPVPCQHSPAPDRAAWLASPACPWVGEVAVSLSRAKLCKLLIPAPGSRMPNWGKLGKLRHPLIRRYCSALSRPATWNHYFFLGPEKEKKNPTYPATSGSFLCSFSCLQHY